MDAMQGADLVLSFMSIAELRMGAIAAGWGIQRRTLLEQFIESFAAEYPDDTMCSLWAMLRAEARAAGRSLSAQDVWIAATALRLNAELATNNRRDFEHIRNLRLLAA